MSAETLGWLNDNVLIGFTDQRESAWWSRSGIDSKGRPNHFTGAVPLVEVERRLFHWTPEPAEILFRYSGPRDLVTRQWVGKVGVIRPDTGEFFGIFGEDYPMTGYRQRLLDGLSNITDTPRAELGIASAGLLNGGARAWVQIEEPNTTEGPAGIKFRTSLLAASSMDGTLSNTFKKVVTLVVCDNTLSAALGEAGPTYRYKNTGNGRLQVATAREALKIVMDTRDDVSRELADMVSTPLPDRAWEVFLSDHVELNRAQAKADAGGARSTSALTRAEKKRDEIMALYRNDPRVAPWAGTIFGGLQAVNTWDHWVQAGLRDGTQRVERNADRMVTGYYDKMDGDVLAKLRKFAAAV